ncbi:MAG: hypothetical protein GX166_09045 [Clostridiaceae bacterium]|nr:hypothetical protein [Clostridiaceae bacterium]
MIKRICLFVIVIECLLVVYVMGKGFETNLENLKGVESSWEVTDKGLKDGSEQTVYDFCVSDTSVDGSKSFVYNVEFEKESGYGAGILLGFKDSSSRKGILDSFIYFIADPDNVYYSVFENGNMVAGPVGRPLYEEEKSSDMVLTCQYIKQTETCVFYINGNYVGMYANKDKVAGKMGLVAHDASVYFTKAKLMVLDDSKEETRFETNMTGWKGVESSWKETDVGYIDGNEQNAYDFAMSDIYVDGTKSFVYKVEMARMGGYGFGIVFGASSSDERNTILNNSTLFLVDTRSVLYNRNQQENVAKPLGEELKDPLLKEFKEDSKVYKLRLEYHAEDEMAILYLDDLDVFVIDDPEFVVGYLGVFAHEGNARVLSAKFEEMAETDETEKPVKTQSPEPSEKVEEKDEKGSMLYIWIGLGVLLIVLAFIFVIVKRRKG